MTERSWTNVDKRDWGDGPWQTEPDKVQWVDEATGLDCLIVRGLSGGLCGYVGLPPGHRYHGAAHDDVDVGVHGGLTFASGCDENAPEGTGICHVPEPGRPADVWWLGFDCAHAFDVSPGLEAQARKLGWPPRPRFEGLPADTYKTVDYVRHEIEALARQLGLYGKKP